MPLSQAPNPGKSTPRNRPPATPERSMMTTSWDSFCFLMKSAASNPAMPAPTITIGRLSLGGRRTELPDDRLDRPCARTDRCSIRAIILSRAGWQRVDFGGEFSLARFTRPGPQNLPRVPNSFCSQALGAPNAQPHTFCQKHFAVLAETPSGRHTRRAVVKSLVHAFGFTLIRLELAWLIEL